MSHARWNELLDTDGIAMRDHGAALERFARDVVAAMGEDPCRYDHHGYCQTHWLHEKPCPFERIRPTLAALDRIEGYE